MQDGKYIADEVTRAKINAKESKEDKFNTS
jgi:hypothetical protein